MPSIGVAAVRPAAYAEKSGQEVRTLHRLGAELAAWLDLIAGLSADPSPDFPHAPVLRLLEASFDAPASCAYTRTPNTWKAPAFRYSDSTPPLPRTTTSSRTR